MPASNQYARCASRAPCRSSTEIQCTATLGMSIWLNELYSLIAMGRGLMPSWFSMAR